MKQNLIRFVKHNSSTILTIIAAVGVVATGVELVKATKKSSKILEEAIEEKGEELTNQEKIIKTAPVYFSSVVLGASTIVCIFSMNTISKKQQASIASAYAILDRTYKDYRGKVVEKFGEETDRDIQNEIILEKRDDDIIAYTPGIGPLPTKGELVTFYESYRGKYFESTIENVLNAEYHFNRNFALRGTVVLDEFYEFLGLSPIEGGDRLGWDCERLLYEYETPWVDFSHRLITLDDGFTCYAIEFPVPPAIVDI